MTAAQLGTAQLGETGVEMARVGPGARASGGGGGCDFGWGPREDIQSIAAIHRALDLGVDAIDIYQIHWPIPEEDVEEGGRRSRIARLADDDWRKHDPRFLELQRPTAIAERYGTTPGHPAVDAAIVGFRRPDQVDPILPAASLELTEEDLGEIEGVSP
jgi:aryl-alcohol dehydrogenase-like predicted oxidoreductase